MSDAVEGTTWVGFLRAINLGASRRFAAGEIVAALRGAGLTDVLTRGGTGNVRVTSELASRDQVRARMEEAFAADRGFDVPVSLLTPAELRAVADELDEVGAGHEGAHYASLLREQPTPEAVAALEAYEAPGERVVVRGRAAHLLLGPQVHRSRLGNHVVERLVGTATARSRGVVADLAGRWC